MKIKKREYFSKSDVKYKGESASYMYTFLNPNHCDYSLIFNKDNLPEIKDKKVIPLWYHKYIIGQLCGEYSKDYNDAYFIDAAIVYAPNILQARYIYAKFNYIDYTECNLIGYFGDYITIGDKRFKRFKCSDRIGYKPVLIW